MLASPKPSKWRVEASVCCMWEGAQQAKIKKIQKIAQTCPKEEFSILVQEIIFFSLQRRDFQETVFWSETVTFWC